MISETTKNVLASLITLNHQLTAYISAHSFITNANNAAKGTMSKEQKARHQQIKALRKIRADIQAEIMEIKGLIGNQQGKKEMELSPAQLKRIKELEGKIADTVTQLDNLNASENPAHHGTPGTFDIVGKLEVLQDLFHVKTSEDLRKTLPESRSQAIARSDRATRSRYTMLKKAADGDEAALRSFYTEYVVNYSNWKSFLKTPDGRWVRNADDFAASMNNRTPDNRAELIYRWSGVSKEEAESGARKSPDVPLTDDETPTLSAKEIYAIVSATADILRKTEKIDDWLQSQAARSIDAHEQDISDPDAVDWIQGDSSRSVIRQREADYARS